MLFRSIKWLGATYALHQIVLTRSLIAAVVTLVVLAATARLALLRTRHWSLHMVRGLLLVASNSAFFMGLIDGLIIDQADADQARPIEALGIRALVAPTVMTSLEDRIALAGCTLGFARTLPRRGQPRRWRKPPVVP